MHSGQSLSVPLTQESAGRLTLLNQVLEENLKDYFDNNDNHENSLVSIQGIFDEINGIGPQFANETIDKIKERYLENNVNRIWDVYNLNENEKIKVKKALALRDKLNRLSKVTILCEIEKGIYKYLDQVLACVIRNQKPCHQVFFQAQQLFGINFDDKPKTMDVLKKIFDVCHLLGMKRDFYISLGINSRAIKIYEIDYHSAHMPDEYSSTDKFPSKVIKNMLVEGLKKLMFDLAKGVYKNEHNDRRKFDGGFILSFEFLKNAFKNLGEEEEYKQSLTEVYETITSRQYISSSLDIYYEIRRSEKEHVSPELELAVKLSELIDVARLLLQLKEPSVEELSDLDAIQYLKNLKKFINDSNLQDPVGIEIVNCINSPILSPILYEEINAEIGKVKDRKSLINSVKKLVKTIEIPEINNNIRIRISIAKIETCTKIRNIQDNWITIIKSLIPSIKENGIVNEKGFQPKKNSKLSLFNQPYSDWNRVLDENARYLNVSDDFLQAQKKFINDSDLRSIYYLGLPTKSLSKIIKYVFINLPDVNAYSEILALGSALNSKPINKFYQDIFLRIMEHYQPSNNKYTDDFLNKLAKLIRQIDEAQRNSLRHEEFIEGLWKCDLTSKDVMIKLITTLKEIRSDESFYLVCCLSEVNSEFFSDQDYETLFKKSLNKLKQLRSQHTFSIVDCNIAKYIGQLLLANKGYFITGKEKNKFEENIAWLSKNFPNDMEDLTAYIHFSELYQQEEQLRQLQQRELPPSPHVLIQQRLHEGVASNLGQEKLCILAEVNDTLIIEAGDNVNSKKLYTLNDPLIQAWKQAGIKEITLITDSGKSDIEGIYKAANEPKTHGAVCFDYSPNMTYGSIPLPVIVEYLKGQGFRVNAVMTKADIIYNQGPGRVYNDYLKNDYDSALDYARKKAQSKQHMPTKAYVPKYKEVETKEEKFNCLVKELDINTTSIHPSVFSIADDTQRHAIAKGKMFEYAAKSNQPNSHMIYFGNNEHCIAQIKHQYQAYNMKFALSTCHVKQARETEQFKPDIAEINWAQSQEQYHIAINNSMAAEYRIRQFKQEVQKLIDHKPRFNPILMSNTNKKEALRSLLVLLDQAINSTEFTYINDVIEVWRGEDKDLDGQSNKMIITDHRNRFFKHRRNQNKDNAKETYTEDAIERLAEKYGDVVVSAYWRHHFYQHAFDTMQEDAKSLSFEENSSGRLIETNFSHGRLSC